MAHGEILAELLPLRAASETDFIVSTAGRVRKDDLVSDLFDDAILAAIAAALAAIDERLGGVIMARQSPFLITGDGEDISDTKIDLLVAYMQSIAGTSFGASFPPDTAKKVLFQGGKFLRSVFRTVETWGTGATIHGDGPVTQFDGIGLLITDNDYDIQDVSFHTVSSLDARPPGYVALTFNGPLRGGHLENIRIKGYETGIFRNADFASFEEWSSIKINQCRDGVVIGYSSFQADQCNIIDCDDYCLLVMKSGEIKWSNSTIRGAGIANLALITTRGGGIVENYWHQMTITGADPITFPILSVNDVGGFGQLVIGTEIAVNSIADIGSIMTEYWNYHDNGEKYYYASDLVRVQGASGQVDSITVGAVELLSAPVPFNTTTRLTCTDVVAAINAGTDTHGFTAKDANTFFHVNDESSASLGDTVVASCSGGDLTVIGQAHVEFTTATPHGFSVGEWSQSDCAGYEGCEPIRYVPDANTFVWHIPFTGTAAGSVWRPHWYTDATNGIRIIADDYNAIIPAITAVDRVTLTTDIPYADISALGPEAVISTPGNDIYIDCLDGFNTGVNDQFFIGGNVNRTFIASGTDIMFKGTRLKNEIIVVPRANLNLRPQGLMFELPARGRAEETLSVVPVTGAATGWGRQGFNINNDLDESYWFAQVPARDLQIINGIPQVNETRWYRNRIEQRIGDEVIATYQTELASFQAGEFYHPNAANINRIRIQDAPAGAGPIISVISGGDTPDTNDDLRLNPLGTGRLRWGVHTSASDAPTNGYVEIRTAAGALVKLATIA